MGDNRNQVLIEQSMLDFARAAEKERLIDRRRPSWVQHSCSLLLMVILVGLLHKRTSIRGIARLYHGKSTSEKMRELFEPYFEKELSEHGFPSYSCIDRFLQSADTEALSVYLSQWSYQLIDDDGVRRLNWGVDGQAARGSKLTREGGRPKYNVDYHDNDSNILVYMTSVGFKSQESVAARESVQDVLSGHPNVVLGADAMMTKKDILEGARQVGAMTFMPVKRNNPVLMNGFSKVVEDLATEGSPVVGHYVDLNGSPDGVGSEVVRETICTYEEEDNKKYDPDLRSRPVRELVFFDDAYPYGRETKSNTISCSGQEVSTSLQLDRDAQGKWFKVGDRYIVMSPSHGRYERRENELIKAPDKCDIWKNVPDALKREWQPYIATLCVVTRYRACPICVDAGKGHNKPRSLSYQVTVTRTAFALSFVPDSTKAAASLIRRYWSIEGKLHKVVDDILGQDACTCRVGNSIGNMSLLRKTAYNVLSGAKNAVKKLANKDIGFVDVLDTLSLRSDLACRLLFEEPTESFGYYARNCYPIGA